MKEFQKVRIICRRKKAVSVLRTVCNCPDYCEAGPLYTQVYNGPHKPHVRKNSVLWLVVGVVNSWQWHSLGRRNHSLAP